MLSKIIGVGNKIELLRVSGSNNPSNGEGQKVYVSQVYEIIDEDRIKIAIPIEAGKLILMPNNTRIDACFYTSKGLYQGRFIIVDRYKEGNLLIQVVELINELQKYQRRQYFRLSCTMGIMYKDLTKEEQEAYLNGEKIEEDILDDTGLLPGVALDISGGGMRFVCKEKHEKNDHVLCMLSLESEEEQRKMGIYSRVISCETVKNNNKLFEHRIEFINLDGAVREYIIKYIFEEERRRRKKENGQ